MLLEGAFRNAIIHHGHHLFVESVVVIHHLVIQGCLLSFLHLEDHGYLHSHLCFELTGCDKCIKIEFLKSQHTFCQVFNSARQTSKLSIGKENRLDPRFYLLSNSTYLDHVSFKLLFHAQNLGKALPTDLTHNTLVMLGL